MHTQIIKMNDGYKITQVMRLIDEDYRISSK